MRKAIAIAGAGISGMSTAWVLRNEGYDITIYAKAFSPNITSDKAAAFWFPYHIRNDTRGIEWCNTSYQYYRAFSINEHTGISMHQLIKVQRNGADEEDSWKNFLPEGSYQAVAREALFTGIEKAYQVEVPLIETQIFLPWLKEQLEKRDVQFIQQEIHSLRDLSGNYSAVINCTALGARKLCNDDAVIPVRGQVGLLAPGPLLPIYLDNERPLYIVPRQDAIIIGGTYEVDESTEATEPGTINRLLKNAYEIFPQLAQQAITGSWAGLRPYRADVRVEKETGANIIHNYGHGGSGFTLSFGCAETVKKLLSNLAALD